MDDTAAHAGAAEVPKADAAKRYVTVGLRNDAGSIADKRTLELGLELADFIIESLKGPFCYDGMIDVAFFESDAEGEPTSAPD